MRRLYGKHVLRNVAALTAVGVPLLAARVARADCMEDFQRSAAAQIVELDTQDQTQSRTTTTRTDLKTGKAIASVVTEHDPPDRTRTILRGGTTVEETVSTKDRLWVGHGGALQEVPATIAKERIETAHKHLLAYRAQLAATDWSKRAQRLTCSTEATPDGHKAELFGFNDAETGMATKLWADPTSFEPLRTEATGKGFSLVQTVERDPAIHIDLPATPE